MNRPELPPDTNADALTVVLGQAGDFYARLRQPTRADLCAAARLVCDRLLSFWQVKRAVREEARRQAFQRPPAGYGTANYELPDDLATARALDRLGFVDPEADAARLGVLLAFLVASENPERPADPASALEADAKYRTGPGDPLRYSYLRGPALLAAVHARIGNGFAIETGATDAGSLQTVTVRWRRLYAPGWAGPGTPIPRLGVPNGGGILSDERTAEKNDAGEWFATLEDALRYVLTYEDAADARDAARKEPEQ